MCIRDSLEVDGQCIAQTPAIARFCGKLAGLYPEEALAGARVDELLHSVEQLTSVLGPSMIEKDPTRKAELRDLAGTHHLPALLAMLERRVCGFGDGPWAVGQHMTVADIALWRALSWLTGGILDGIPTTLLDSAPRLRRLVDHVDALPKVREWMQQHYGGDR